MSFPEVNDSLESYEFGNPLDKNPDLLDKKIQVVDYTILQQLKQSEIIIKPSIHTTLTQIHFLLGHGFYTHCLYLF